MPDDLYRCPGEDHAISRAVHLGRLAASYAACQQCPRREETGILSSRHVQRLTKTWRRAVTPPLFDAEGISGVLVNELRPQTVRKLARALGIYLQRDGRSSPPPAVVVGSDGRSLTAELFAATSEGLRLAGCRVVEIGAATAGAVAWAVHHLQAAAGVLVGNPRGEVHTAGLKLWTAGAAPCSAGGSLDGVREIFQNGADRPTRSYGGLERFAADEPYLARLQSHFHALRPLRCVLDTACQPLVGYLRMLTADAACELIEPALPQAPEKRSAFRQGSVEQTFLSRRLAQLSQQVRRDQAHFGIWIDGDGDTCHVVDDRGRSIAGEHLLFVLARYLLVERPDSRVVLESGSGSIVADRIASSGWQVLTSETTRQAMDAAMRGGRAICGGGPSGRFWFAAEVPLADALLTFSLLLSVLSQSDRSLSEVLDAA